MVCDHTLNSQNLVVQEVKWLHFPRLEASPHLEGPPPLVAYKWSPNHCGKDMVIANQVFFFHFLQGPLCPICVTWSGFSVHGHYYHINGHQIQQLRRQDIWANLQMEGHVGMPSKSQKYPEEMGVLGSSPSHLPSWSPTRRLLPSHPNTRHCLGIHMTLTEEIGTVPPLPHTWTAPLVEYMLCYGRTGLTEAIVMGPGRGILFYGRQSLGEGLSLGKAWDAAFILTGVGTWVGKPAYLAADPLTIQKGWWAISHAITEHWIKARGPEHLCINLLTPQPFRFDCLGDSAQRTPPEMPIPTINHCPTNLQGAGTTINVEEIRSYHHLSYPCHPQIMDLKVIGIRCQQPHQCCHCQTGWKAPNMVENIGRPEPTWRLIYLSLKMRMQRMLSPTRVGGGIWWYTVVQNAEIAPSSHTPSGHCKVIPEN